MNFRPLIAYFEGGGHLQLPDDLPAEALVRELRALPELLELTDRLEVKAGDAAPLVAAAGEFILEGLWAQKKIGRSEDKGFVAVERRPESELDLDRLERLRGMKKQVN
jgi:magnesium chelatase subunit I